MDFKYLIMCEGNNEFEIKIIYIVFPKLSLFKVGVFILLGLKFCI